jgi:hypothetical protein
MSIGLSWWLLALLVGGSAPFWVRAIVNRWERQAQVQTERLITQFENEQSAAGKLSVQ